MEYWWVWSHQSASMKLKTMKFSSKGLGNNSTKFCTSENFLLYSSHLPWTYYTYNSLKDVPWYTAHMYSTRLATISSITMITMVSSWRRVKDLLDFPLFLVNLVLKGRPRAHQHDPIRALHSSTLHIGIATRSISTKKEREKSRITNGQTHHYLHPILKYACTSF